MKWRIYYDTGYVFSSDDGRPEDAPKYGVIAIWQEDPHDKLFNTDYYIWKTDCWMNVDLLGLIDHLVNSLDEIKSVLIGRTVPGPIFSEIMNRMNTDARM